MEPDPKSTKNRNSTKILIYRHGAVGDTILTAPVLETLRRIHNNPEITVMGHLDRCRLLVREGLAHHAVSSEIFPLYTLSTENPLPDPLRHFLKGFDVCLWYGIDRHGTLENHLKACIRTVCLWPPKPEEHSGIHIIDHLLEPAAGTGRIGEGPIVRLPISDTEHKRGQMLCQELDILPDETLILLAPGTSNPAKRWPLDNFARLAGELKLIKCKNDAITQMHIAVLHGPEEEIIGEQLYGLLKPLSEQEKCKTSLLPVLSLEDVAALITTASFYAGNDSGLTHLSAALGIPTLAIFICTDPQIWSPRGANSSWIMAKDGNYLQQVNDEAQRLFSKGTGSALG